MSQEADEKLRGEIEDAGVQFKDVDPAALIEKTKPVYEEWGAQLPELVDLVQKEAAKAAGAS